MREAMDIATTGCSVNVSCRRIKKTIEDARIAYGVAGPVPMRAPSAEAAAKGKVLTKETVKAFAGAVLEDIRPRDSWRASKAFPAAYIAVVLAERALREAVRLAGEVKLMSKQYKLVSCTINGKKVEKMVWMSAHPLPICCGRLPTDEREKKL